VLAAVADYVLTHGVADLSLRSVARAVGTSHRMLLYHFGSKELLVRAAIEEARTRNGRRLSCAIARQEPATLPELVHRVWRWYASPRRAGFLRLIFEVSALALQNPQRFPGVLGTFATDLVEFVEEGFVCAGYPRRESRARASLYVGAVRGLLMDLLATGDRSRLEAAATLLSEAMARDLGTLSKCRGDGHRTVGSFPFSVK
jgi:AcrR family transcriptional regulator